MGTQILNTNFWSKYRKQRLETRDTKETSRQNDLKTSKRIHKAKDSHVGSTRNCQNSALELEKLANKRRFRKRLHKAWIFDKKIKLCLKLCEKVVCCFLPVLWLTVYLLPSFDLFRHYLSLFSCRHLFNFQQQATNYRSKFVCGLIYDCARWQPNSDNEILDFNFCIFWYLFSHILYSNTVSNC